MPKFGCVCGYVLSLSTDTTEYEWALVPEATIDSVAAQTAVSIMSEDEFYAAIGKGSSVVYRCPECFRIHVDEGGGLFRSYVREIN